MLQRNGKIKSQLCNPRSATVMKRIHVRQAVQLLCARINISLSVLDSLLNFSWSMSVKNSVPSVPLTKLSLVLG